MSKIYLFNIKICFKAFHISIKPRKCVISADTSYLYIFHTGYSFDQTMREHNVTFQKLKVLSYLEYN